jgi:dTDP-4-amino-4,6-dideoxygalactose transaminase
MVRRISNQQQTIQNKPKLGRPVIGVGTLTISRVAQKYVQDVLRNNRLSYGPYINKFETDFARIHNVRNAVMVNSGTDALRIALNVLKDKYGYHDGDEVIVPAVTFVATANIVIQNGLVPVFVDVDPIHYELNPLLIEKKITTKTRAIIPVHLFGQPCDMDPILAIAKNHQLRVIEDSCETMFAKYKGRSVGTLGTIACFSTYVAHLIVTGVGGLITTNDDELAVEARSYLNHGRDQSYLKIDDDQTKSFAELHNIVAKRFHFSKVGYSSRITEMEGALGLAQLEEYETMLRKRRLIARMLTDALSEFNDYIQLPKIRQENEHSFMMYPIVCKAETKDELINFLEQGGIETRDMLPVTNQPVYKKIFQICEEDYPVADWINKNGFYIGCHQDLTKDDIAFIHDNFRSYFSKDSAGAKREFAMIVLKNNIDNYNFVTKIQNIPFRLFNEVVILDHPLAKDLIDMIKNEYPNIKIIENVKIKNLTDLFLNRTKCDNIVFFDLTNMHNPQDIKRILFKLENGVDMAIASRFILGGKKLETGVISYRGIGNRFFTGLMNVLFNGNCTDSMTSLRGIKRKCLADFKINSRNWYDYHYNLSILAIQKSLSLDEFPSKEILFDDTRSVHNKITSVILLVGTLLRRFLLK